MFVLGNFVYICAGRLAFMRRQAIQVIVLSHKYRSY